MTPLFSVIMPIYNVEAFVAEAIDSVLAQTLGDFELLIIDDLGNDGSRRICEQYDDSRIRIVTHPVNRGLAGARNTGIREARGRFMAFIDSDDIWMPEKLARHLAHFEHGPDVGLSFSRSAFIDAGGHPMNYYQMPQLTNITAGYLFCRNPVGNGSAPVLRREALEGIAYRADISGEKNAVCYFDERLRRSEDIECWVRVALQTTWRIEGINQPLTLYRLNAGGLSSSLDQQYASWQSIVEHTRHYAPEFIKEWYPRAQAYQLRYLARQAIRLRDGSFALRYITRATRSWPGIWLDEPGRTLATTGAALLLGTIPKRIYLFLEKIAQGVIGHFQRKRINAGETR
ncbi:glycosyltransferase family 2 protein [Larsenimonas rhizosphaerae]|uniref:Glycosyltransferase family 2 protein n=1 Tax=Larsenimonas rhizosphaerae TaxID=2944682 RepID=A0AA41ZFD9_9GAMM|nr:glycosyltransferase family 2 protein [Larsenimonas rhizosphaerae]MCM2130916.1 glycosyltransferase [Larsenimonas rhizosphaerae]MCX2523621.1 glycosyltransferase family 2 protein [Larsenimonas rhizosphaerae]